MKRFWKVGVAVAVVLALGGVAAGIVAAQTGGTSTPTRQDATATEQTGTSTGQNAAPSGQGATPEQKRRALRDEFLDKLAANLGVSVGDLRQAITTTGAQLLDQAVADGKITADEAQKIKDRIASGDMLFPFGGRGHGHGHDGPDFRPFPGGDIVKQTADFLGISRQDVLDGLKNKQSLAQIAEAHGKTADGLSGYLNDQLKNALDQAVTDNRITQDREDRVLSKAKDRIDQAINRPGPLGRHGPWHDKEAPDGRTPSDDTPSGTANPTSL